MAKDFSEETFETINSQTNAGNQIRIQVDEEDVPTTYASICRVSGTAEEFTVDFAGPLKQTGQGTASLRVLERVYLNPWAAKRLAMMLQQAVGQYEQTYGTIELDERKRRVGGQ
ncbi:MAG: DUF3467 domain-containing protein [Phycisphaeraceae bacterium]|nr:DUF3467 domain-containing protein [Phycisphaeraceae bacterium]